jgi:hypothetical protein
VYVWEAGIINLIPDWHAVLSMGAGNYLWGGITMALLPDPIPNTWGELQVGIGLFSSLAWIVLTIATVWLIRARREPNSATSSTLNSRRSHQRCLEVRDFSGVADGDRFR